MSDHCYTAREYAPEDWEMVQGWWQGHDTQRTFARAILPPVGIIVERDKEPVAAVWCYMSAGIGVAFLEHPVSRPGLSLLETASAMNFALDAMEAICRTHNYGLLIANTLPAIARWLERRRGFSRGGERIQMLKILT